MTMPFYTSPEQLMRERSEIARKGIARGRSVVVLRFVDGVLFVAENHSGTLHKISEIYDRIGFAAVGRYPEFENLRVAGIRHADLRGVSYDRSDVSGRSLANAYAQTLGSIFTEQLKPYEVELCLAEVGATPADDLLYRITYDGSIYEEEDFVVMGGTTEPISTAMRDAYRPDMSLTDAVAAALGALRSTGGSGSASGSGSSAAAANNADTRELGTRQLEVAVLDRRRPRRAFRRLVGPALDAVLPGGTPTDDPADAEAPPAAADAPAAATSEAAAPADAAGAPAESPAAPASDKPDTTGAAGTAKPSAGTGTGTAGSAKSGAGTGTAGSASSAEPGEATEGTDADGAAGGAPANPPFGDASGDAARPADTDPSADPKSPKDTNAGEDPTKST